MKSFYTWVPLLLFLDAAGIGLAQTCKCSPDSDCWPSDSDFHALNNTVSGQLIRGSPPASVCYPSQSNYNEAACQLVLDGWHNSSYHASDPISIGWPNGTFVTPNACHNAELFWAIRSSGGGTFGIVTEVTMRAYPSPQTARYNIILTLIPGVNSSTFFNIAARIFSDLPRLKNAGVQGYFHFYPPGYPGVGQWTLDWGFYVYDKPNGTIEALFHPLAKWLDSMNGTTIYYSACVDYAPTFIDMWNAHVPAEPVAVAGTAMGSRLLPASAFTNVSRLATTLEGVAIPALCGGPTVVEGLFVANSDRNEDVAMNPFWRKTVLHMAVVELFPDRLNYDIVMPIVDRVKNERVGLLRDLAPDAGAYFNEADAYDPDWQQDFFGANYAKLEELKRLYDTQSVLWCISCVGSEEWIEVEQQSGKLCQANAE